MHMRMLLVGCWVDVCAESVLGATLLDAVEHGVELISELSDCHFVF